MVTGFNTDVEHAGRVYHVQTEDKGAGNPLIETAERVTIQVVVGQVRVVLQSGESAELSDGAFTAIERSRLHEIECLQEGAFLLTLAWPAPRRADVEPFEL